jgi:hypothetical protein
VKLVYSSLQQTSRKQVRIDFEALCSYVDILDTVLFSVLLHCCQNPGQQRRHIYPQNPDQITRFISGPGLPKTCSFSLQTKEHLARLCKDVQPQTYVVR